LTPDREGSVAAFVSPTSPSPVGTLQQPIGPFAARPLATASSSAESAPTAQAAAAEAAL